MGFTRGAHEFTSGFSGVRVARSLVLCRFLIDCCLSFFIRSLCCLSFVDIRILLVARGMVVLASVVAYITMHPYGKDTCLK